MKVTIKDVANKAGVSPITVSRAFSRTHPVAETTRQKIFQVADELGYVPDLLARALVQKQIPIIGMTVLELANPFFAPIIDAVQAESRKRNFMVIVSQSERQENLEHDSLNQYRQMRVAGILVTPVESDLKYLQRLREGGTNVVVVAREWEKGDFVTVDDFLGGKIVGEHLSKLGHGKIGCIALDEPQNTALQSRIAGFKQVLSESGTTLSEGCTILTETLRTDQGIHAADVFMGIAEKPSAVFVTADRLAIGFLHRLREHGVRIPEDVAVVGYDDIRYSEFLEIPLTTVALPKYEMGQQATRILFERIEAGEEQVEAQQIHLEPELIVRESCGANLVKDM
jgi:LacI family transcriptional regulator